MPSLNDRAIFEAHKNGELVIEPWNGANVQPGSIDLTLGDTIDIFQPEQEIDLNQDCKELLEGRTKKDVPADGYPLAPGETVIGHSAETIRLPQYLNGLILNRNSLIRIGLNAALSQYINPGFHGNKIIVLQNIGKVTIRLKAGIRICQLVLFNMGANSVRSYDERHSLEAIRQMGGAIKEHQDPLENSISDFMNARIAQLAGGL